MHVPPRSLCGQPNQVSQVCQPRRPVEVASHARPAHEAGVASAVRTMPEVRGMAATHACRVVPGTGVVGCGIHEQRSPPIASESQPCHAVRSQSANMQGVMRRPSQRVQVVGDQACAGASRASDLKTQEELQAALKEQQQAYERDVAQLEQMLKQESAVKALLTARLAAQEDSKLDCAKPGSLKGSLESSIKLGSVELGSDDSTIIMCSGSDSSSTPASPRLAEEDKHVGAFEQNDVHQASPTIEYECVN